MSRSVRPAILLLAALALLTTGCGGGAERPASARSATPSPVDRLDVGALRLARVAFCPVVPDAAVTDALGGAPDDSTSWGNGDRTAVDGDREDVVHEYGCAWRRDDVEASAWIFARPVSAGFARAVLAKTSTRKGCRARPGSGFGTPSQRQVCTLPDGRVRTRVSGLFQDTWLTCQVTVPADQADDAATRAALGRRTDVWCVQVANATDTAD